MRYLVLLFATFLFTMTAQPVSAATTHRSSNAAQMNASSLQRPITTLRARFERTADRITAKILNLLPPAFQPAPDADDAGAPTNRMANISFWCGIAGYLGIYPALPVALVTGIIALNQICDSGEGGKSRAIAGIVMGGAPFAIAILVFAWINGQ